MNINDLIDNIDKVTFVEKENPFNIKMIYFLTGDRFKTLWYVAKENVKQCDMLNYTDWRIPTIEEFEVLNKLVNDKYFGRGHWYWCNKTPSNIIAQYYLVYDYRCSTSRLFFKSEANCGIILIR